jgi:hypothetical protein
MASQDEIPRMKIENDIYLMHQTEIYDEQKFVNNQYSSQDCIISKNDLYSFLKEKNFYKPT